MPTPFDKGDLDRLAAALRIRKVRVANEADMHCDVERHLAALAGEFGRCVPEFPFDSKNRIDFWLPEVRIGIECKVAGGLPSVVPQLQRYAQLAQVGGLVLVTKCRQHRGLPPELCGKPLRVVWAPGRM